MSVQLPRCACWILKQLIKLRSHALTHKMLYTSRHRNSPAEGVGAREAHRKHCMWVSGRDALHTLARTSMKNILCANTHTGTKSCEYTCTHAHSLSHRIHSFFSVLPSQALQEFLRLAGLKGKAEPSPENSKFCIRWLRRFMIRNDASPPSRRNSWRDIRAGCWSHPSKTNFVIQRERPLAALF